MPLQEGFIYSIHQNVLTSFTSSPDRSHRVSTARAVLIPSRSDRTRLKEKILCSLRSLRLDRIMSSVVTIKVAQTNSPASSLLMTTVRICLHEYTSVEESLYMVTNSEDDNEEKIADSGVADIAIDDSGNVVTLKEGFRS